MSLSLHIIRARDFLRTTPTGQLDWEASRNLFATTAKAAAELKGCAILLDLRQVESSNLSDTQIWYLVERLYEYDPVFREQTAILIPPNAPGDRARFFEVCATNRGFRVRAFNDYEHAINWLMTPTELKPAE